MMSMKCVGLYFVGKPYLYDMIIITAVYTAWMAFTFGTCFVSELFCQCEEEDFLLKNRNALGSAWASSNHIIYCIVLIITLVGRTYKAEMESHQQNVALILTFITMSIDVFSGSVALMFSYHQRYGAGGETDEDAHDDQKI